MYAWVLFNSAAKLFTVSKTSLHRVSISVIHHYSASCLIYNYRSVWRFSHCRAWCPITSTWQQITKALVIGDSAVLPNTARSSVFSKGRSICCLGQIKCGVIARGGSPECSASASPLTLWHQKVWRGLCALAHTKYTQRACGSVCVFACAQHPSTQKTKPFLNLCVRACVTSKQKGFAGVVKPGHLGNSIGGIGQVKFIDDVNLVVLIRSESQSWGREMKVSDAQRWVKTPLWALNLTAGF